MCGFMFLCISMRKLSSVMCNNIFCFGSFSVLISILIFNIHYILTNGTQESAQQYIVWTKTALLSNRENASLSMLYLNDVLYIFL